MDPYPTSSTIGEWDDASLLAATGYAAAIRYHEEGFETLNQTERALCCFCLIESNINNGGVGQWINSLCPLIAKETPRALKAIGATEMASFITAALRPLGDTTAIPSKAAWVERYFSVPDTVHGRWERMTPQYLACEDRFLELACGYARANWQKVRAGP